ncbi:MAG: hypothetical protein MJ007_03195 [Paludibacteraceae bacterium]|nr:hypothetical protein [Paludibacteraceae bacterium]
MKKSVFIILCSALPMLMMAQNTTVKDCQGHVYPVVKIGNQYWMAENLQCTKYDTQSERAGASVFTYTDDLSRYSPYYADGRNYVGETTKNLTAENKKKLGLLYNWAAAMGYNEKQLFNGSAGDSERRQGICPNGWHLPSYNEFMDLIDFCDGQTIASVRMRTSYGWYKDTFQGKNYVNGVNGYGFSALPAGDAGGKKIYDVGTTCAFWTSTPLSNHHEAYGVLLYCNSAEVTFSDAEMITAVSVRCIKD